MDWRNQVAVVTGASSGIGREVALALAQRGVSVVGVARRESLLCELAEQCRIDAPASDYLAGDLGSRAFAERAIGETVERHGRLDLLVNNAGIPLHKQLYHTSADEAARVMDVNFMSCLWCSFAAIPAMLRAGSGAIVNVGSFAAVAAPPREAVYAASKSAMHGFTMGLWNELHGSGIHAALVTPGAIDTEIWDKQAEPNAFRGRKTPARDVALGVIEVVERRRREITIPRRNPGLVAARWLRQLAPGVLLSGMRRMAPVSQGVIDRARQRAVRGEPLGPPPAGAEIGED